MKSTFSSLLPAMFFTILTISIFPAVALAGPPLICHPLEIDGANSLPWISHNWNLTGGESYDRKRLVSDTVSILNSNPNILVHMETLRRATLYAKTDPLVAKQLLITITAGTKSVSPTNAQTEAIRLFDSGYLAETYKQWLGDQNNPAHGLDGYALVKEAIRLRGGNDPQMEFAAALISLNGPAAEHREFAQKAIAGAKSDPLLAKNLSTHFLGANSETMAEMIGRSKTAKE
jgi:hypothetical protein